MKQFLLFAWLVSHAPASAQDFAPTTLGELVYLALPTNPTNNSQFPAHSAALSSNGTRTQINVSGFPRTLFPATYTWTKTGPSTGTLALTGTTPSSYLDVTFSANFKGTYREIFDSNTAVAVGNISFSPLPQDLTPPLLNLANRGTVTAGKPSIAGFVVGGPTPRRVLIRAVGPSLAQFGVAGAVAKPSLAVFKGNAQIGANAGWGGDASLAAVFAAVGAFALPTTSADCAIVLTLDPGDYTAQITANSNGEALIEVYFVN